VPAQQRLRRDQKRCPSIPGQDLARGGEQGPVERGEPWAAGLAAQHPELLLEDQDLQVFRAVASAGEDQQMGEHADHQRE
jgi:hypothetical protein